MRSAPDLPSPDPRQGSFRSRAAALLLTLAVEALLVLMLLRLAVFPPESRVADMGPTLIQLEPEKNRGSTGARRPTKSKSASGGAPKRAPTPPVTPPTAAKPPPLNMIVMTPQEFAAADIANIPSHHAPSAPDGGGAGTGSGSAQGPASADRGGDGPDGQQLFAADWFRRPTHQELAYYLPSNAPPVGWGMIACRTVAGYRVEDCREIGQSPAGSGLARAVREAAWQFRVLPPRIDGRPVIGAWVRIRIEFTQDTVQVG